jgi:CheY-like chemotaxis protein
VKGTLLSNSLAIVGIFLTGASAGAFVTFIRLNQLLIESHKTIDITSDEPSTPAESKVHLGMKVLIVGRDPEMISLFSHLFREKGIEAQNCLPASGAVEQLSREKFESMVLDFDEIADCHNILMNLPRPNEGVLVIGVASDSDQKETATRAGVTFVIERPLTPAQVREVLRAAYGRMFRDRQRYFRLAVEVAVSIRTGSGTVTQCTTLNVSQTGMAINSLSSFIVGEPISLALAIPNTDVFVSGEGTVIWDDKHGKTGISFECSSPSVQSRYYEWLQDHFFMRQGDFADSDLSEQVAHVR